MEPVFGWTLLSADAIRRVEARLREDAQGVRDEIGFMYPVLERFQRNLTISTLDCGAFRVLTARTDDRVDQAEFAQAGTAAPVTIPHTTPPKSDAAAQC